MARILVIDDDSGIREVLETTIHSAGHEVLCAANGREGLALHRLAPAALAIVDLIMPVQDGMVTIHELRRATPDLPVIVITGHPNMGQMLMLARRWGAGGILEKPFRPDELLRAVAAALAAPG